MLTRNHSKDIHGTNKSGKTAPLLSLSLSHHLPNFSDSLSRHFLTEGTRCYRDRCLRRYCFSSSLLSFWVLLQCSNNIYSEINVRFDCDARVKFLSIHRKRVRCRLFHFTLCVCMCLVFGILLVSGFVCFKLFMLVFVWQVLICMKWEWEKECAHSFRRHLFCFPCSKIETDLVSLCEWECVQTPLVLAKNRLVKTSTRKEAGMRECARAGGWLDERINETHRENEREKMQKMCFRRCWTLRTHLKHAFAINLILCSVNYCFIMSLSSFFFVFRSHSALYHFRCAACSFSYISWPKVVYVNVLWKRFFLANVVFFFVLWRRAWDERGQLHKPLVQRQCSFASTWIIIL